MTIEFNVPFPEAAYDMPKRNSLREFAELKILLETREDQFLTALELVALRQWFNKMDLNMIINYCYSDFQLVCDILGLSPGPAMPWTVWPSSSNELIAQINN